ncbi:MAG: hypothetical protein WCV79_00940 [Candidatus Paceibacterota bacterium]|jgi:hypothetical protein
MNGYLHLFNLVLLSLVFVLLTSYGIGYIGGGGHPAGKRIFTWEVKMLLRSGRWLLKNTFRTLAITFQWLQNKI